MVIGVCLWQRRHLWRASGGGEAGIAQSNTGEMWLWVEEPEALIILSY